MSTSTQKMRELTRGDTAARAAAVSDATREANVKCRLCRSRLDPAEGDDFDKGLCSSCADRPEAKLLGISQQNASTRGGKPRVTRDFTPAEKSLIKNVHGYMPADQLLAQLNERLVCDLGEDAAPYTMEQLYEEIGDTAECLPAGGHDRVSLRRRLAKAESDGTLARITEQTIMDFAVVYSLNPKQVQTLKEIVLQEGEDD